MVKVNDRSGMRGRGEIDVLEPEGMEMWEGYSFTFFHGGCRRGQSSDDVADRRVRDAKLLHCADCLEEVMEILPEHGGVPPDAQTGYVGRDRKSVV